MIRLKALAVGIVFGLLAAVLWVLGNLWLPVYAAEVLCRLQHCGAAAAGGFVSSDSTLLVALAGFAGGFYWTIKRARRSTNLIQNR